MCGYFETEGVRIRMEGVRPFRLMDDAGTGSKEDWPTGALCCIKLPGFPSHVRACVTFLWEHLNLAHGIQPFKLPFWIQFMEEQLWPCSPTQEYVRILQARPFRRRLISDQCELQPIDQSRAAGAGAERQVNSNRAPAWLKCWSLTTVVATGPPILPAVPVIEAATLEQQ
jgi:hypothetical protein